MSEPASILREALLSAALSPDTAIERVEATRIELPAGAAAGLHLHPCDVVGCVSSGTIRFQIEGAPEQRLTAGDAFHEPAHARIAHFDNASDREPAVFVAFYLLPPGEERRIVML